MRLLLSHPTTPTSPGWPGNEIYEITRIRSTAAGDFNNSCIVRFHEHFSTHFDAPFHFNADGPSITELPFDYFFYEKPLLIELPKGAYEKIEIADLEPYADQIAACDFLMIRTGYESIRESDPELYKMGCPAVTPECCLHIAKTWGKTLKTIALDCVSLVCPSDTSGTGPAAHRNLLGCNSEDFVCVIEDTHLAEIPAGAKIIRAASVPLMLTDIDSGPVTVWAEIED